MIEGAVDAATLVGLIEAGGGSATLNTVQGSTLTATVVEGNVILTDAQGNTATVVATGLQASNGVVHVIDGVLLP